MEEIKLNLNDFLWNALLLGQREIDGLEIEEVNRMRTAPDNMVFDEICVRTATTESRDFLSNQGIKLASYKKDGQYYTWTTTTLRTRQTHYNRTYG